MPGIVCAIRGGPASRPTIKKSIELAAETSLPLYFLYIVNLNFLTHTSSTRTHLISKEMKEMGEFILLTAQAVAQSAGIRAEGAGYPISYAYFLRKGLPAMLITVGLATVWLLIRFSV
jgi:hypothetical protein